MILDFKISNHALLIAHNSFSIKKGHLKTRKNRFRDTPVTY